MGALASVLGRPEFGVRRRRRSRITGIFMSKRERAGGVGERRRPREEAHGVGRNVTCRGEEPSGAFDSCVVAKLHFTLTVGEMVSFAVPTVDMASGDGQDGRVVRHCRVSVCRTLNDFCLTLLRAGCSSSRRQSLADCSSSCCCGWRGRA